MTWCNLYVRWGLCAERCSLIEQWQSQAMDNITTGFIRQPSTLELEWASVVQGLLDALHNTPQVQRLMPSALKGRLLDHAQSLFVPR